jgi:hypothetical protein
METWLLLLLGFSCISVFCTLLIFSACIVSHKATAAREPGRSAHPQRVEDVVTKCERVRAIWRRR